MYKSSAMLCHRHLRLLQAEAQARSKLVPLVRPRMKAHVAAYPVASITGHVTNPTNEYEALKEALVAFGPQVPGRGDSRVVNPGRSDQKRKTCCCGL